MGHRGECVSLRGNHIPFKGDWLTTQSCFILQVSKLPGCLKVDFPALSLNFYVLVDVDLTSVMGVNKIRDDFRMACVHTLSHFMHARKAN